MYGSRFKYNEVVIVVKNENEMKKKNEMKNENKMKKFSFFTIAITTSIITLRFTRAVRYDRDYNYDNDVM